MTECLIRDGVYVIKNAPDRECLLEFMKGIGAKAQSTHYGDQNWKIKNNPNSKDLPNSSKKLELHIDMPYLEKPQQVIELFAKSCERHEFEKFRLARI